VDPQQNAQYQEQYMTKMEFEVKINAWFKERNKKKEIHPLFENYSEEIH